MDKANEKAVYHYNLGIQYEKENNVAEAKAEYKRALEADGAFPYPYRAMGEIFYREGRLDEIRRCIACNEACWGRASHPDGITCSLNPSVGQPSTAVAATGSTTLSTGSTTAAGSASLISGLCSRPTAAISATAASSPGLPEP